MAQVRTKATDSNSLLQWGAATKALKGQTESGDRYLVKPVNVGYLVAVVDGLGHGDEAALAAEKAISTIDAYANESVMTILRRCHDHMRTTRGAVGSLVLFDGRDESIMWLGVG
ncbi:MAG: hypothetical protein ACRDGA_02510, partial [Bacteroidota bacterium]